MSVKKPFSCHKAYFPCPNPDLFRVKITVRSDTFSISIMIGSIGIAYAEAIKLALDQISTSSSYRSLISSGDIGYAIRDSCGDAVVERHVVYEFNRAALAYSVNKTLPRPVDIVMAAFRLNSVNSLHLLNVESIPQISYATNNAKLTQNTKNERLAVQNLISVYPENTMALQVIIVIFVQGVFSC